MNYEAIINGAKVYLKSFIQGNETIYVNILTGCIECPMFVNPMRVAQENYYRKEIINCKLPENLPTFENKITE